MLKQRVITALILAAVFLAALFGLSAQHFSAFLAAITLLGAWEWSRLSGIRSLFARIGYLLLVLLVLLLTASYLGLLAYHCPLLEAHGGDINTRYRHVLLIGCGWWAVALLWVQTYPTSALLWGRRWLRALMGLLVLIPCWAAFTYVRSQAQGAWLVLMIVAIVAAADIGGYFVGRRWGRHKLALSVSPGKTWEGFAGGAGANVLLSLIIWPLSHHSWALILALMVPASLVSVLGDLLESMVKRECGVKDSGTLLPGHGGLLDRLDSLTAAAPVFALALLITHSAVG